MLENGESLQSLLPQKVTQDLKIEQATLPTPLVGISILNGRPLPPRVKDAYVVALKLLGKMAVR